MKSPPSLKLRRAKEVMTMMNFGNLGQGYGMMGSGFGVLATIFWVVILIDLILLGVWLWKQIQKR